MRLRFAIVNGKPISYQPLYESIIYPQHVSEKVTDPGFETIPSRLIVPRSTRVDIIKLKVRVRKNTDPGTDRTDWGGHTFSGSFRVRAVCSESCTYGSEGGSLTYVA